MIDGPDITAEWLASTLRASVADVVVRSVGIEKIGTGQTGASYRLHLDADHLPTTLVAKTAAGDRAARGRVGQGYRSEVGFYTVLRDQVQVRTPRCWHAEISDDNCSFVLLLDDLSPARPGVQVDGCGIDQARDAVRNLAGLHAPLWNSSSLHDHPDFLSPMTGDRADFLANIVVSAAEVFCDRYVAELRDDADTLRRSAALTGRWTGIATGAIALLHGDYRLDNLMFPEHGDGVYAVDWQTLSVGPPGRDLGYFLATSLHVDDRRAHEETLLREYVEELHRLGVADFTIDDCMTEYRLGVLQAPMITMLGAAYATAERSDPADAMFVAMATRAAAALRDLDSFALVESR